jgi:hypothetical protein
MTPGGPFKFRGLSTPYVGSLSTPDVVKYKIPIPFAFVPPNPKYNPREHHHTEAVRTTETLNAGRFKKESNCQKQVQNFNQCLRNNKENAAEFCAYYLNYLNLNCKN